ncbi:YggS family pyridoxal phosphate-dependent enzyme [Pacificimonas sp. ICDLI1SI03]
MGTAHHRLNEIGERIDRAARLMGRSARDVTLIAVSKMHDAEDVRPLLQAGHRHFGENRVQEAEAKWPSLLAEYPDTVLHMIGQLQSNKAEQAVAMFDVIHSVDRPSLVKALGKAIVKLDRTPQFFVQVDIGEEPQKGGCAVDKLPDLLQKCADHGLDVVGLMCIPPADTEAAPYFALLRKLAEQQGLPLLSMGMSADFETAVMVGASHVRVGTALFGARDRPE